MGTQVCQRDYRGGCPPRENGLGLGVANSVEKQVIWDVREEPDAC